MRSQFTIVTLSLALIGAFAAAQTAPLPPAWKWIDATGRIQYSDTPPPQSVPDKKILERPPVQRRVVAAAASAASAASAAAATLAIGTPKADPELEARRKRAADEQAAQQRQQRERDAAIRADNCKRARDQLALFTDGQRITRTNAQGEREVVDDKTRADETQRVRMYIAGECK